MCYSTVFYVLVVISSFYLLRNGKYFSQKWSNWLLLMSIVIFLVSIRFTFMRRRTSAGMNVKARRWLTSGYNLTLWFGNLRVEETVILMVNRSAKEDLLRLDCLLSFLSRPCLRISFMGFGVTYSPPMNGVMFDSRL